MKRGERTISGSFMIKVANCHNQSHNCNKDQQEQSSRLKDDNEYTKKNNK